MLDYVHNRDFATIEPHFKPGEKPTIFHVREVPHDLWESFVMGATDSERALRAFMCGVEKAENVYTRDGNTMTWTPALNGTRNVMSTEEATSRFSPSERMEIGEVIFAHSFLAPRIEGGFRLPPLLGELLARRAFLHADASPSDAAPSSSQPSATTEPLPTETAHISTRDAVA